jgi:hypothetical protein
MAGLGRTDGIGPPDPRTIRDGSKTPENARHAHRPDPRHPLVPLCEGVLGTEDPETLAARGDLATWTGLSGDPAAARDQFADLAPVCKRILGSRLSQTASRATLRLARSRTAETLVAEHPSRAIFIDKERSLSEDNTANGSDTLAMAQIL